MDTIGKRVKKVRIDAGIKQGELGSEIGIAESYVSKIEIGAANPGRAVLKSICARFGVNEEWLLTGEGPQYIALRDIAPGYPPGAALSDQWIIEGNRIVSIDYKEIGRYLDMARVILTSDDEVIKDALKSNLRAFVRGLEHEKKMTKSEEEIHHLKNSIASSCDPPEDAGAGD